MFLLILKAWCWRSIRGVQAGKTIRFSHDPRNFTGTSLYNEWEYLKNKYGYIDLLPVGDFWYGIR